MAPRPSWRHKGDHTYVLEDGPNSDIRAVGECASVSADARLRWQDQPMPAGQASYRQDKDKIKAAAKPEPKGKQKGNEKGKNKGKNKGKQKENNRKSDKTPAKPKGGDPMNRAQTWFIREVLSYQAHPRGRAHAHRVRVDALAQAIGHLNPDWCLDVTHRILRVFPRILGIDNDDVSRSF